MVATKEGHRQFFGYAGLGKNQGRVRNLSTTNRWGGRRGTDDVPSGGQESTKHWTCSFWPPPTQKTGRDPGGRNTTHHGSKSDITQRDRRMSMPLSHGRERVWQDERKGAFQLTRRKTTKKGRKGGGGRKEQSGQEECGEGAVRSGVGAAAAAAKTTTTRGGGSGGRKRNRGRKRGERAVAATSAAAATAASASSSAGRGRWWW